MLHPYLAALPAYTGIILLVIGAIICVVSHIQFLIVAAKRSIGWLLGVLFLPFVGLILVFVEPESRGPFFRNILGALIAVGGLFLGLDDKGDASSSGAAETSPTLENSQSSLQQQEVEVRDWQARLQAKKARLVPGDAAGQAAFDAELKEYMTKLEAVKRARTAAGVK